MRAQLRVPAVAPSAIWRALSDPARMVGWFQRHQSLLALEGSPSQDAYFRGAYHFWSFFTPHAPPESQHVLLEAHWPGPDDGEIRLRYRWTLRGHVSDIRVDLAPLDSGTHIGILHSGLPEQLPGLGSARAYWTLVLENMRLYLLGRDGLQFQEELEQRQVGVATDLITPAGLDATAAAWELLTGGELEAGGLLLPPGLRPDATLRRDPPHGDGAGGAAAQLDLRWQQDSLGLPGVLSWRLAGRGARTRITIVQSGFAEPVTEAGGEHWLADWRAVLGQLRGRLDLGDDWSRVETD